MAYEITKLIKKSLKREAEFQRKQVNFLGQMNVFPYIQYGLANSENSLPNKVDSQSCISVWYSEELWNFDEAVWMGAKQCQLLASSMDFSLPSQCFPIQITSALAFREQSYVQWMLKRMPSFQSLFFEVYDQTGMQDSIGAGHSSYCELGVINTFTSMSA